MSSRPSKSNTGAGKSSGPGGDGARPKKRPAGPYDEPCPSRFIKPARKPRLPPWLPRAGLDSELEQDSVLLRAANNFYPEGDGEGNCSQYPPLMQADSWTRGVPYRDSYDHTGPSDSIGNCYTVATKTMRLRNMPPKKREPPKLFGPIGPNGELQFPPLKPWAERERERLQEERKGSSRNKLQKGLVRLEDLVSGAYDKRKADEAAAKQRRLEKKRQEKEAADLFAKETLRRKLASLEFEEPRDPDDQKKEMLAITEEEHYRFLDPEDLKRVEYYLTVVSI
ncbi:unnamed protein product [Chrysodeixis includens]|uniref:Uncharacterized protein n=1 Tax=Chrysodeixis includens TaxID=689277 RepID=A0A9P0BKK0_CHRIL|nr:unnamed protein product [Chrysodeixis includens]